MRKYAPGQFATEFTHEAHACRVPLPESCGRSQGKIAVGLCLLLALGAVGISQQRSSLPVTRLKTSKFENFGVGLASCVILQTEVGRSCPKQKPRELRGPRVHNPFQRYAKTRV